MHKCLSGEDANSTGSLDLRLSLLAEELGLDDNGDLRESTLAEDLEESSTGNIDDGSLAILAVSVRLSKSAQKRGTRACRRSRWGRGAGSSCSGSDAYQPYRSNQGDTCPSRFCGGAYHQRYRDRRRACGACLRTNNT